MQAWLVQRYDPLSISLYLVYGSASRHVSSQKSICFTKWAYCLFPAVLVFFCSGFL